MIKKSYYAIIPASVRYDEDLSPSAKLLYGEITALANERGYCWASNKYFADSYGVSKRSVRTWIKQLEDKGYITVKILYKENSKEVAERRLYIETSGEKLDGVVKKSSGGANENFHYNNTNNNTNNNIYSRAELDRTSDSQEDIKRIVDYLNKKADKKFKATSQATKKHINARLSEGYTFDDFVRVIDKKVEDWKFDQKMQQYLRPQTLFGTKFEAYLNEAPTYKKEESNQPTGFDINNFFDDV